MSANVETLFYVREKPWHGMGIRLEDAPTSADAIVAAGLDWKVESKPVYINYGGSRQKVDNYFANTRMSDGKVLGVVSGKYTVVQNEEAFKFTDALVDEGLTYETAGSLEGGKNIWLLGKMPRDKILDDDLEPYVCFTNRHDGLGSVRVCMTPTRVVCQNTLNFALSTAKRAWSTRHVGDMQSKLEEAKYTLGLISEYTEALKTEAERLAELSVSDAMLEQMLTNVYPVKEDDSDIKKKRAEMLKANIFKCLDAPDVKKYRGTAFGAMMAVTDYADHSQPIRLTESYKEARWGQIIVGHPFVDQMYKQIQKVS